MMICKLNTNGFEKPNYQKYFLLSITLCFELPDRAAFFALKNYTYTS